MTQRVRGAPLRGGNKTAALTVSEPARRDEILQQAAALFAVSGLVATTLKDVADACGILPGSLYHHFESKEAICIELVERFHADLDRVGRDAQKMPGGSSPAEIYQRILSLSTATAECAVRHGAALQLTTYEPPAGASQRLVKLARREPASINRAMTAIMRKGQESGLIKPGIDVDSLASELSLKMLDIATGVTHRSADARDAALTMTHLLLDGAASNPPSDARLNRSVAMRAAKGVIQAWAKSDHSEPVDKAGYLLAAARSEFALRGYDATTIRDIASAAGTSTGSVYRMVESKQALIVSIMGSFQDEVSGGYTTVLKSDSTALEKLDALLWLDVNFFERFPQEFAITKSWLRGISHATRDLGAFHDERSEQIKAVVAEGIRLGELRADYTGAAAPNPDVLARCLFDLTWPSYRLLEKHGKQGTLAYFRATVLRGAANPPRATEDPRAPLLQGTG